MTSFTPVASLIGGSLIGLSVVLAMLFFGRIAGISGIFGAALRLESEGGRFRYGFLTGLLLSGSIAYFSTGQMPGIVIPVPLPLLLVGGFLVGFGSGLGSGCTSGHGLCGVARLSKRSIAATATFLATGMMTVFLLRHVWGIW
ncbi:MAG: YeeE/YedE family protein [Rhodothalassiaceae bacterium]